MATPPTLSTTSTKPKEYWKDPSLNLSAGSVDEKFAKAKRKTANVPHNHVSDMQNDLISLGYLKTGSDDGDYGLGTKRAVQRFQRHANRKIRLLNKLKVVAAGAGLAETGVCNSATALEIRNWISKKYHLPIGIYQLTKIDGGTLREDVAKEWKKVIADIEGKGGMLVPATGVKYSDTIRYPKSGFKSTGGNSRYSLHYTGRAIDLSMDPAGGKGQRWWVEKESDGSDIFWRIYCKTEKQDGSQGTEIKPKSKKYYEFWKNKGEAWMPQGYYLDLTKILQSFKFERIKAQAGWEKIAKKSEWWHFFYNVDIQATFLDEMELIGYSEVELIKSGWTKQNLDHAPG